MSERSKGACDKPKSMPQSKAYDDGYDRIFKKKPKDKNSKQCWDCRFDSTCSIKAVKETNCIHYS